MKKNNVQLSLLAHEKPGKHKKSYGGELLKTRKGRIGGRPVSTRSSMHLVLRSSKARGDWSFKRPKNERKIHKIVSRFSEKYGVKIHSLANVGNHLHFQLKFGHRGAYKAFIRAVTSAIAMAVSGAGRGRPLAGIVEGRFWDYRPFTRIVTGLKDFLNLRDYIYVNKLEGFGYKRGRARYFIKSFSHVCLRGLAP